MYYAIHKGKNPGVYNTWEEAKEQIYKFKGAKYKKFSSYEEAKMYVKTGTSEALVRRPTVVQKKATQEKKSKESVKNEASSHIRIVYTDGATSNNQEANKAKGGCGVYFGYDTDKNLSIPFNDRPTNNRCELYAIILSLETSLDFLYRNEKNKLLIYTDSKYSILMTEKIRDKPVQMSYANYNMLMLLYFMLKPIRAQVEFRHVKAHTNKEDIHSMGNRKADELAVKATGY
jgi:ribonuclease HI